MYSLEFRAWIGSRDEIDPEDHEEFFDKEFNTIEEAKAFIYNDCLKWREGEFAGCYITISFGREPKIFDGEGKPVSKCIITDWNDMEFEWVDY